MPRWMKHPARRSLAALTVALAVSASAGDAAAQPAWPTKPVTFVVTYPPGGGADLMARLIAPKMSEVLGQPVVVDNKPGAAGQIGAAYVAKARPDGYTVMVDASSFAINPGLYPKLPYDPKAFRTVGVAALFPHVVVVTPGFEATSATELVALARAKPDAISYASSGTGSAQHLAGALFQQRTGARMLHVPYKGGGPAMNDVMGGHIPVFFANVASALSHVKAGKLRPLAIAGEHRVDALPDTPALAEAGITGAELYEWNGVFVPVGTPDAVVVRLSQALARAVESPEVEGRIRSLGGRVFAGGPAEAAGFIAAETERLAGVVKTGDIRPE